AEVIEVIGVNRDGRPAERPTLNVYAGLTVTALRTKNVQLGIAVTNPYTRNVGVTAAAAATVDELSGGRVSLGFGAGGGLGHYGVDRSRPAVAVREAVNVTRPVVAGESV